MGYSNFTLGSVTSSFGIKIVEDIKFLAGIEHIVPSTVFTEYLEYNVRLAIALGTEKARSELIIAPILVEIKKILNDKISFFSGEDFNIDIPLGLNGVCDFLISRSPEQLFIEAPAVVIVEAKKGDLKPGLGQCIAEMIAAQMFNANKSQNIKSIYGSITTGTQWMFLKLVDKTLFIDLIEYNLPPVDQVLGFLVWMIQNEV